ncbi:MAG: hypothetical protein ABIQ95_04480, partial [Bdellovibrionia bacterium]
SSACALHEKLNKDKSPNMPKIPVLERRFLIVIKIYSDRIPMSSTTPGIFQFFIVKTDLPILVYYKY